MLKLLKYLKYRWDKSMYNTFTIIYNPEFRTKQYSLFRGEICVDVFDTFDEAKLAMQQRVNANRERCYFEYDKNGNFVEKRKGS